MSSEPLNTDFDVAIVVALREEFDSLFRDSYLSPEESIPQRLGQWYRWEFGAGTRSIVTFVGDMGQKAIEFATRFLEHVRPRILVNVGLSGSLSKDVKLGDIVVASLTDLYEDAGAIEEENGIPYLRPSGRPIETEDFKLVAEHFSYRHEESFRTWKSACDSNRRHLGSALSLVPPELLAPEINLHVGHIACVGSVVRSMTWKRSMLKRDRKYLAVDMESGGIAMPAGEARREGVRMLIVRGISDSGDERKEFLDSLGAGAIRRLALRNALEFLKVFLPVATIARNRVLGSERKVAACVPWAQRNRPSLQASSTPSGGNAPTAQLLIGVWIAKFTYTDGNTYREIIEIMQEGDDIFVGRIVPSADNCPHTAEIDHLRPTRVRGALNGTPYFTGTWFHSARQGVHGAFQLRVSFEEDRLSGGWLMFSDSSNGVVSGDWQWHRHVLATARVIGIYGITGAGKTTLCQAWSARSGDFAFFSESELIDQHMKRFYESTLEDFKGCSEATRMELRQEAFDFHRERVRNARGRFLADAHYSFPARRLGAGAEEKPHPEAEGGIQPVMPEAAWSLYQAIIYLDTPPETIAGRLNAEAARAGRNTWAANMSVEELRSWSDYEKRRLREHCQRRGKNFFILDGEGPPEDLAARADALIMTTTSEAY